MVENLGIVPRFIHDLFDRLDKKKSTIPNFESQVLVSFLELYNEDLVDLLSFQRRRRANSAAGNTCEISIREDNCGNIYWSGVREEPCDSTSELLGYLAKGSLNRTTGPTDMNAVSSRSHAIFSVILKQVVPDEDSGERKTVISKFHFVDLAGSERLDRTGAQGVRAREGIAINSGLLALGNVISALGDDSRRSTHIPYRDSKLTRLLQDSLGGNSQTLMVACVSPADSNMQETLSTLKYANRARNIKNRVSVNQEFAGSSVEVNQLRLQIAKLRMELNLARSNGSGTNNGTSGITDKEVQALRNEINRLRSRVQETSDELCQVAAERDTLLLERQQFSSSDVPATTGTLPIVAHYQKTICNLRNELEDTKERLAFVESTQGPMLHALAMTTHMTPTTSASRSRSRTTRKKRASRPTIAFRSTRAAKTVSSHEPKQKVATSKPLPVSPTDHQDIELWLQETISPLKTSLSKDIRSDVRNSISKARMEIEKGLRVLENVKVRGSFITSRTCCSLHTQLQKNRRYIDTQPREQAALHMDKFNNETGGGHSRGSSGADTGFTEDTELAEICQSNPDLARVIGQIQSDIHVKEELVSQLERCETEYVHMRHKFEQKISKLSHKILSIKQPTGQREKQQLTEMRHAYEQKIKTLHAELSEVRRKMNQVANEMLASRNQNITMKRALKINIEASKLEKRQMVQRMKEDAMRIKEQTNARDREIQKLRRRQQRDTEERRRLERENKKFQHLLRKKSDEMLVADDKLRKLGQILRKAVREGGVLDGKLLGKCAELLHIGARLAISSSNSRPKAPSNSSARRSPRRSNFVSRVPVHIRAAKKKELLDRALYQYIQGKQAIVEMQSLIAKRSELSQKKADLQSEREHLYGKSERPDRNSNNFTPFDHAMQNYMDDRLEAITAEISYINARIQSLHNDAAHMMLGGQEIEVVDLDLQQQKQRRAKHVTFADDVMGTIKKTDEDEWSDMDALEERYALPADADPDTSHDMALKVIRSLLPEEAEKVMEVLVEDIAALRMDELSRHSQVHQLEQTIQDLQHTLSAMKDKAVESAITNDKRLRRIEQRSSRRSSLSGYCCEEALQDDDDSAIDVRAEEHFNQLGSFYDAARQTTTAAAPAPGSRPLSPAQAESEDNQISLSSSQSIRPMRPQSLIDRPPSVAARRDSMSSPDQFLQQLVQAASLPRMPMDAFFDSIPVRKPLEEIASLPALQLTSSNVAVPILGRRRAFSLQQPAIKSRRRFSLRELSLNNQNDSRASNHLHQPSPLQQQFVIPDSPPNTPSGIDPPRLPPSPPANVFHRLSNSHTRASVAKRSSTPIHL
ncbi:hypothetical protein BX666DRAFT_1867533 [Dichotomocladium elegans]|nr:hypothetical protein BX666DRAFT_1867533 [Dichotomocladium elegans]